MMLTIFSVRSSVGIELIGHASIAITLDRYGHLFPADRCRGGVRRLR